MSCLSRFQTKLISDYSPVIEDGEENEHEDETSPDY